MRQLEAGERYARQAAAAAAAAAASSGRRRPGQISSFGGRFRGPTEAEQLAAVSQYAKYANYVPVLAPAARNTSGCGGAGATLGKRAKKLFQRQQQQQQQPSSQAQLAAPSDTGRTSLLGRPLKVEAHHKDLRFRKKQNIIYNFLERPHGCGAAIYHLLL